MSDKKKGRPTTSEGKRETLTKITFKADAETLEAVTKLTDVANEARWGVKLARSAAIRRALIEAAERIPKLLR